MLVQGSSTCGSPAWELYFTVCSMFLLISTNKKNNNNRFLLSELYKYNTNIEAIFNKIIFIYKTWWVQNMSFKSILSQLWMWIAKSESIWSIVRLTDHLEYKCTDNVSKVIVPEKLFSALAITKYKYTVVSKWLQWEDRGSQQHAIPRCIVSCVHVNFRKSNCSFYILWDVIREWDRIYRRKMSLR